MPALQTTSVSMSRVYVRDHREPALPAFSAPMTSAGTAEEELLPRGTALVVTKRTSRAGPSYRGRIYVPGFGEGSNEAGGRAADRKRGGEGKGGGVGGGRGRGGG